MWHVTRKTKNVHDVLSFRGAGEWGGGGEYRNLFGAWNAQAKKSQGSSPKKAHRWKRRKNKAKRKTAEFECCSIFKLLLVNTGNRSTREVCRLCTHWCDMNAVVKPAEVTWRQTTWTSSKLACSGDWASEQKTRASIFLYFCTFKQKDTNTGYALKL